MKYRVYVHTYMPTLPVDEVIVLWIDGNTIHAHQVERSSTCELNIPLLAGSMSATWGLKNEKRQDFIYATRPKLAKAESVLLRWGLMSVGGVIILLYVSKYTMCCFNFLENWMISSDAGGRVGVEKVCVGQK